MNCNSLPFLTRYILFAVLLLLAGGVLFWKSSKARTPGQVRVAHNNPQDFFIWVTNSSVSYSFRYDPRGADEWLFHNGAWLFAASTSKPPGRVTGSTN